MRKLELRKLIDLKSKELETMNSYKSEYQRKYEFYAEEASQKEKELEELQTELNKLMFLGE